MKLVVIPVGIPKELVGVDLPVQVVLPSGDVAYRMVRLREGEPIELTVEEPGPYRIRAELPSGRQFTATSGNEALVELRLSTLPSLDLEWIAGLGSEGPPSEWLESRLLDLAHHLPTQSFERRQAYSVEYGFIKSVFYQDRRIHITLDNLNSGVESLPGQVTWEKLPEWDHSRSWRPCLLVFSHPVSGERPFAVLAPPSANGSPVVLSTAASDGPSDPPFIATFSTSDPTSDLVFNYVQSGATSIASYMADDIRARANEMLRRKFDDPVSACVAGYALLRLGKIDHLDWWGNLAHRFPFLPDGSILFAWALMRSGRAEEAARWFVTATTHGLPIYTEGVRLLHDGLALTARHLEESAKLTSALELAHALALAMNPESPITFFRVDGSIDVRRS